VPKLNRRLLAYGWLLVNTLCWGAALPIVKPLFDYTTPFRYLLYRYVFSGILCLPIVIYYLKKQPKLFKFVGIITLVELIGTTLALSMLYFGLAKTSALEASIIATATPIFIILGGVIFLKEKQERNETFGSLLAFLATLVLSVYPFIYISHRGAGFSWLGNILILLQNVVTAVYLLLAKKYYHQVPKFFAAIISFYVGLVSFFFLSLFELGPRASQLIQVVQSDFSHVEVWVGVVFMATFGSIIGLTAYLKGQEYIEASEASIFTYLQPLVYVPLVVFWLNEKISSIEIICLVVILLGVVIAEKRFKKPSTRVKLATVTKRKKRNFHP
jgi:drug/metabolite transporter (DMT)-like permease